MEFRKRWKIKRSQTTLTNWWQAWCCLGDARMLASTPWTWMIQVIMSSPLTPSTIHWSYSRYQYMCSRLHFRRPLLFWKGAHGCEVLWRSHGWLRLRQHGGLRFRVYGLRLWFWQHGLRLRKHGLRLWYGLWDGIWLRIRFWGLWPWWIWIRFQ